MEHLENYIDAELTNLKKSINRTRSEQNTREKIDLFNEYFQQYEALVRNKKSKCTTEVASLFDANHNRVREKVEKALEILKNPSRHATGPDDKIQNDKDGKLTILNNNANTSEEEKILTLIEQATDDEIKDLETSNKLNNSEWINDKIDGFHAKSTTRILDLFLSS